MPPVYYREGIENYYMTKDKYLSEKDKINKTNLAETLEYTPYRFKSERFPKTPK